MKLIAETAWHHQGDFEFMKDLISKISNETQADVVKMHITINFDEYMDKSHAAYDLLKPWVFTKEQWRALIEIVRKSDKELMLLANDTEAVMFASSFKPEYMEIHSVCLNDLFLLKKMKEVLTPETKMILGVGGTDLYEIEYAMNYLEHANTILMFGFQNYPTIYKNVNLKKIRKIMDLYPCLEFGYADHTVWNSPHNELVTLLGAANGMDYIEKHVSTLYGEERVDWAAAISIDMFNSLAKNLKLLEELNGDGKLEMNEGELKYSVFGPMKKAAILIRDVKKDEIFSEDMIKFTRTQSVSDMSQIDIINSFGKKLQTDMCEGEVLMHSSFL